jgi:3-methylfumaryl-CoA hydratase
MTCEAMIEPELEPAEDTCSLSLVRRMAALLDLAPDAYRIGDPLPRGWHVILFNSPTVQSLLRHDGAASLGFNMPDLGLPRLMMGGRKMAFDGDIPIGASLIRRSSLGPVVRKTGRTGPFALVEVEHKLTIADSGQAVVLETSSYVLRPEEERTGQSDQPPLAHDSLIAPDLPEGALARTFVPDETMLFRYSAVTDNPHRIHYDFPYATHVEGYPALVVNGSLPQMLLLQMFREYAGREPAGYESRNRAPIFCGLPVTLSVCRQGERYALAAHKNDGQLAIEAEAW